MNTITLTFPNEHKESSIQELGTFFMQFKSLYTHFNFYEKIDSKELVNYTLEDLLGELK